MGILDRQVIARLARRGRDLRIGSAATAAVLVAVVLSSLSAASQTAPTLRPGELTTGDIALAVSRIPRFTPDRFVALPPSVRELMRHNNTLEVHDAIANRVVGAFNPGKTMREALLA